MVSYASVVVSFLLLAGPMIVLNGVAPETVGPWNAAMLIVTGLFLFWLAAQMHEVFVRLRYVESIEETDNIVFLPEYAIAEATKPYQTLELRKPDEPAARSSRATTAAHGSPVS